MQESEISRSTSGEAEAVIKEGLSLAAGRLGPLEYADDI